MADAIWRLFFSLAVAVLMFTILVIRGEPLAEWFVIAYPAIGALLALVASRSGLARSSKVSPGISMRTGMAALLLFALINLLLVDYMYKQYLAQVFETGSEMDRRAFLWLPAVSFCIWMALYCRQRRGRRARAEKAVEKQFAQRRNDPIKGY